MDPLSHTLPMPDGDLAYSTWGSGPAVIVAIHGITATSRHFAVLAQSLEGTLGDRFTLIAPDLRGRGRSRGLVGPFGMAAHAQDCLAILDHVGAPSAVVVGHSMGGFVAAVLAVTAPDRVDHVVLADGGVDLGLPVPDDVEATVAAVIGPALARLAMTFDDPEAYVQFWRAHPALDETVNWEAVEPAIAYDLVAEATTDGGRTWRPTPVREQILGDAADMLTDPTTRQAADQIGVPMTLVWCGRGLDGSAPGLYPDAVAAGFGRRFPNATVAELHDVNHYTMVLSVAGADDLAGHITRAVSSRPAGKDA